MRLGGMALCRAIHVVLKISLFFQRALEGHRRVFGLLVGCFLLFLNRGLSFICIFKRLL